MLLMQYCPFELQPSNRAVSRIISHLILVIQLIVNTHDTTTLKGAMTFILKRICRKPLLGPTEKLRALGLEKECGKGLAATTTVANVRLTAHPARDTTAVYNVVSGSSHGGNQTSRAKIAGFLQSCSEACTAKPCAASLIRYLV